MNGRNAKRSILTRCRIRYDTKRRSGMKQIWYGILQVIWGMPQTLLGFAVFLCLYKQPHYRYRGAVVTGWKKRTGLSLGLFLFVPEGTSGKDFLVHEYGHTIQSLILGPLYLLVIGLPSVVWCNLPWCVTFRRKRKISYYAFYTEWWANRLGERKLDLGK